MWTHSEAVSEQRNVQDKLNETLIYYALAKQNEVNNLTFILL